jgi:hypothetical protein
MPGAARIHTTPQSPSALGGFRLQGKSTAQAKKIVPAPAYWFGMREEDYDELLRLLD